MCLVFLGSLVLLIVHCSTAVKDASIVREHDAEDTTVSLYYTDTVIKSANGGQVAEKCNARVLLSRKAARLRGIQTGVQSSVGLGAAVLIFALVGIFAAGIASAFQMVRKHVYHDADSLDTAFDAGGQVSIGLTATTIVSQWTWTATLLQSTTVASKFGISGPYWYAGGATIQIIIFSILSIKLKTRAPGAKTFLQVIRARFGKRTHLVFCTFAFFTNLVVMMSLTIAGVEVLHSLVSGMSTELASMLLAAVIGGYTLIGGLGATFYVSYFNTTLIFVLVLLLVVEVFYNPLSNPENPFGSAEALFDYISCWRVPGGGQGGNRGGSYLTFFSSGGLVFGIVNIVGNFGTVFCDQAYWQSSVAAKPLQGVWGFISGGLTWFAIPFSLATTMGLAYLGLSSAQGVPLLSDEDIAKGLAAPLVAQKLLGTTGEYAMLFLILMAVMSTGSAEVIAVASIIIYDVYQIYVCPYRENLQDGQCILCGLQMRGKLGSGDICSCESATNCSQCKLDSEARARCRSLVRPRPSCYTHGGYKEHQEHLLNYKNWCIVICTLLIIPLCLFCSAVNLNLGWTYYFTGILISCAVVPIALSIMWARATSVALISGTVSGCVGGIVSWLAFASTFPGGLSADTFVKNTGQEMPMMVGNLVSISVGAIVSILVSFCTRWRMSEEEEEAEWEKTRDIDNPLSPWILVYREELDLKDGDYKQDRPSIDLIDRKFRGAKIISYTAAVAFTVLFVFIWPGSMLSVDILDFGGFNAWTTISKIWAFVAAAFIIILPMVQEVRAILHQISSNKQTRLRAGTVTDEQPPPEPLSNNNAPLSTEAVNGGFSTEAYIQ